MSGDSPIIYWDTCVFIAYLMEEERDDLDLADLESWIEDFDTDTARLITSVITRVEVLDIKSEVKAKQKFQDVFTPPRAAMIQVTPPIADLAHDIRDHYQRGPDDKGGSKTLSTPDAIHLATAIAHDAQVMHSTDHGKTGSRHLGLLEIDPSEDLGTSVHITTELPTRDQTELDLRRPQSNQEESD